MQGQYTESNEEISSSDEAEFDVSSTALHVAQSFFNRPQSHSPSQPPVKEVSLDQQSYTLLYAIYKELKLQNSIAQIKMQRKDEAMQKKSEAAKTEEAADAKRFSEISHSFYN